MSFIAKNFRLVENCPNGFPDKYEYSHPTDTVADIVSEGYFPKLRVTNPNFVMVDCYLADGPYEVQLVGGVASVVYPPEEKLTVITGDSRIDLYQPLGNGRFAYYEILKVTDAGDYIDLWYIHSVKVQKKLTDGSYFTEKHIVDNSAIEVTIRENGALDFVGSNNHGYEEMSSEKFFVDNFDIGTPTSNSYQCSTFEINLVSDIYRLSAPATTIADCSKRFVFTIDTFALDVFIRFPVAVDSDYTYAGMLPVKKLAFRNGLVAPELTPFTMPPSSTQGNRSSSLFVRFFDERGSVSAELSTSEGVDFRGRVINLNADRDKYYASHGGAGSGSPKSFAIGDNVVAKAVYKIVPRGDNNTIYYSGMINARKPANAVFNIDAIGLGFQDGDVLILDAVNFDVSGTPTDLNGQYTIQTVNEGSSSTDIVMNAAHAELVASGWASIGSSTVGAVSGAVSN